MSVMSGDSVMRTGVRLFDADQHYYEPLDAFTRYLPAGWAERAVQRAEVDGRVRYLLGGKVNTSISNPLFDPIVKPGALKDYFRGNPERRDLEDFLKDREPIPSYYRDPVARLAKLDEQGIDAAWVLPTLGMTFEEGLMFDPPACGVAFGAFNRWLLDDWGFSYENRLFIPPYLYMGDVDYATKEVTWALEQGARVFAVRCSGIYTEFGWRSPGDSIFDPVWAQINEAGAVVVPHSGDVGSHGLDRYVKHASNGIVTAPPPLQIVFGHGRPISNYLAALVCDLTFERFPDLRIASVENGADCLPTLLAGLRRAADQRPGYFTVDPVETFKRHIWVAPFWEDSLQDAVALIGADRVLFGSDWPHAEGLQDPHTYQEVTTGLGDPAAERRILFENAAELTGLS